MVVQNDVIFNNKTEKLSPEEKALYATMINPDEKRESYLDEKLEPYLANYILRDEEFAKRCFYKYGITSKQFQNVYAKKLVKVATRAMQTGGLPAAEDFALLYHKELFNEIADREPAIQKTWHQQIQALLLPMNDANKSHIERLAKNFAHCRRVKENIQTLFDNLKKDPADNKALDSYFKTVAEVSLERSKSTKLKEIMTMTGLFALPDPEWLIERHIAAKDLCLIFGPPGEGKTFKAIDWSLSLAAGIPLFGKFKTKKTRIVYVISEGIGGFKRRVQAWCDAHAIDPADVDVHFVPHSFSLVDPTSTQELIELCREKRPGGVFIDTVARNFAPGDENSTKDMSQFVACVDMIRDELNCFVCLIHHSGKNKAAAERGSNALRAAVDFSIEVSKPEGEMMITCHPRKCKEFLGQGYIMEMVPNGPSCSLKFVDDIVEVKEDETKLKIQQVLPSFIVGDENEAGCLTVKQVAEALKITERKARDYLNDLADKKLIQKKKFGNSRSPHKFWLSSIPPSAPK